MLRNDLAITFIGALMCSCASAPAKAPAPHPVSQKTAVTSSAPGPGTAPTPPLASTSPKHGKLKAGECEESFDCVDTVGFPPAGHRWTCENGKCVRARLPDLNPEASEASSVAAETSVHNSKDKSTVKKAKKHHD